MAINVAEDEEEDEDEKNGKSEKVKVKEEEKERDRRGGRLGGGYPSVSYFMRFRFVSFRFHFIYCHA